jgi:hypothetical protein
LAKRGENVEDLDGVVRAAMKVGREIEKDAQEEEPEEEGTPVLAPHTRRGQGATEVASVAKKIHTAVPADAIDHGVENVMANIPEHERAKIRFQFFYKKVGSQGPKIAAGDYPAAGDDWTNKIKAELAKNKGPGSYEGRPKFASGTAVKTDPWVFDIDEGFALDSGWSADKVEEVRLIGAPVPAVEKVVIKVPEGPVKEDRVALAKENLEILKLEVESAKIKNDLAGVVAKNTPASESVKSVTPATDPDITKRLLDAERARLDAEHEAALAKIEAAREATFLKGKNEHEKAMAALENERAADKRRSEEAMAAEKRRAEEALAAEKRRSDDAIAALRTDITRKEDASRTEIGEVKRQLDRFSQTLENKKDEKTDYAALGAAIAAAFAPITPIASAFAKKMLQDPPPPPAPPPAPDVAGMFSAMAQAMKSMQPPPPAAPPTPPDPTKMLEKSLDIVMTRFPVPAAPAPPPPPVDQMALVERVMSMVKTLQPPPAAAAAAPIDPMTFTKQVMEIAQGYASMAGGGNHDRDDDRAPTGDAFDTMLEAKGKLEKLGVVVQVGNTPPATVEEKKGWVRDLFDGAKEAIPSLGEAVAKSGYFQNKSAEAQAKLALEQIEIRKNEDLKKQREIQRRRQQFYQNQNRQQQPQRPQPQYRQVQQPQQAPQQMPQQVAPQQRPQPRQVAPAPQVPAQVAKPRPAQVQVPQQSPAPQQAPQKPQAPTNFGIPTGIYTPPPTMPPAPYPVATIPRRAPPQKSAVPVEHFARVPQQIQQRPAQQNQPPAQLPAPQAQPAQQGQQLTPQQAAAQKAAMEKRARFAQGVQALSGKPPVVQAPAQTAAPQRAPQPQQQAPTAPQGPKVLEELAADNSPTDKTWGSICSTVIPVIGKQDPQLVARHLLASYPHSISMLIGAVGKSVEFLQAGLFSMAGKAGQYGPVVTDLATRIGTEQAKPWASQLLVALHNGGK